MIKRKYFVSTKATHDDNTGLYSHYSFILNTVSWFKIGSDELLDTARFEGLCGLEPESGKCLEKNNIQVIALNRI